MSDPAAETPILEGTCLCGAVRFALEGRPPPVGMCHCSQCRKASGTGSNAVIAVRVERFRWLAGEDQLHTFNLPSGWGVTRCRTCGSPAPRATPDGARVWVPAGALDVDPGPRVAGHIFVGSKPSWDMIGDDAPQFAEGAEGA
jgi:hypothetical protein